MTKQFPILGKTGSVKFVKWDMLNEEWAQKIHGQSLKRLAERGGLGWVEVYWNYYKLPFDSKVIDPKLWKEMVDNIKC